METYHSATVRSVKDVRTLRVCGYCDGLGNAPRMLAGPVKAHAHGRCFVEVHGEAALLRLPREQLDRLTIGDIGPDLMRQILDEMESSPTRVERS